MRTRARGTGAAMGGRRGALKLTHIGTKAYGLPNQVNAETDRTDRRSFTSRLLLALAQMRFAGAAKGNPGLHCSASAPEDPSSSSCFVAVESVTCVADATVPGKQRTELPAKRDGEVVGLSHRRTVRCAADRPPPPRSGHDIRLFIVCHLVDLPRRTPTALGGPF